MRPQTAAKLRVEIENCLRQLPTEAASAFARISNTERPDTTVPPEDDTSANVTVIQGPAPTEGRIFAARYQLAELVGEGASGRTFRAYDGRLDGKLVAVKVLHPELNLSPQAFYHLQSDLGRLRDAPHPHLIETFLLERIHGYKFSVTEWVHGFPLASLLRLRGGLTLSEAFRLLGQAAEAATHCSAHRLHRLDLSPDKTLVGFPAASEDDPAPEAVALARGGLDQWPTFQLKFDALSPAYEARGSVAQNGAGSTPQAAGRDTSASIRSAAEGGYFHALVRLVHALLGVEPPSPEVARALPPLDALNETGNAVLQRAFSANPGFASENEFFHALLKASGLRWEEVGLSKAPTEGFLPVVAKQVAAEAQTRAPQPPPTETRPPAARLPEAKTLPSKPTRAPNPVASQVAPPVTEQKTPIRTEKPIEVRTPAKVPVTLPEPARLRPVAAPEPSQGLPLPSAVVQVPPARPSVVNANLSPVVVGPETESSSAKVARVTEPPEPDHEPERVFVADSMHPAVPVAIIEPLRPSYPAPGPKVKVLPVRLLAIALILVVGGIVAAATMFKHPTSGSHRSVSSGPDQATVNSSKPAGGNVGHEVASTEPAAATPAPVARSEAVVPVTSQGGPIADGIVESSTPIPTASVSPAPAVIADELVSSPGPSPVIETIVEPPVPSASPQSISPTSVETSREKITPPPPNPVASPRRESKGSHELPDAKKTPVGGVSPAGTPNGKAGVKPKPTPPRPMKAIPTPPRNNEDVPDFMR